MTKPEAQPSSPRSQVSTETPRTSCESIAGETVIAGRPKKPGLDMKPAETGGATGPTSAQQPSPNESQTSTASPESPSATSSQAARADSGDAPAARSQPPPVVVTPANGSDAARPESANGAGDSGNGGGSGDSSDDASSPASGAGEADAMPRASREVSSGRSSSITFDTNPAEAVLNHHKKRLRRLSSKRSPPSPPPPR
ncbi:hypothetical protein KEM52_000113 [Ascosphaera acerosa]|nr:hypothetical protein KEM52_000113 [Ascosphaera acerosa]